MIYARKCIEHVWQTQSPPWHIQTISLGIFLVFEVYSALIDVPKSGQELHYKGLIKAALQIGLTSDCMSVCIGMGVCCAHIHMCLSFKAKVVPLQTARVWDTAEPCWFKMLKRDAHTQTNASVEITQECPQISLFNKPGAFIFKRGGCQETSKHRYVFFFFVRPWVKRTCQIHVWDYWEPSPVKKWQQTNERNERKSCEPVSALSPLELCLISCEHQSAMKTAFFFFSFFRYNHFNLLAEGDLEKRNMKKTSRVYNNIFSLSRCLKGGTLRQSCWLTVPLQTAERRRFKGCSGVGWWRRHTAGLFIDFVSCFVGQSRDFGDEIKRTVLVINGDV